MSGSVQRFDQRRKESAGSVDTLAQRCYCEHYSVTPSDVYSVEELPDSEHVRDGGYDVHQILDYGGLDVVIDCGTRHIHVAQRIRPNDRRRVDLSLRTETGVAGRTAELWKWRRAHETHGYVPDIIAFGVYDYVINALLKFMLIKTESVLDAIADERLIADSHPTGDGTAAWYFSSDDIRNEASVVAEWEEVVNDD